MFTLPTLASLFSLLTYKLLQQIILRHYSGNRRGARPALPSPQQSQQQQQPQVVKINAPALTAQQSFENDTEVIQESKKRFTVRQRQQRALEDFFRDTGGRVTDLRVLRSAMFLSDEIDRAVRGLDVENQYVGWRPYNRFYAEGTEELFTNVPTGRSPLVMAAPKAQDDTSNSGQGMSEMKNLNDMAPVLPIQYQAVRQSHLKQVGRAINEIETAERRRLALQNRGHNIQTSPNTSTEVTTTTTSPRRKQGPAVTPFETTQRNRIIKPVNDDQTLAQQRLSSTDLKTGVYQAYEDEPGQAENKRSNIKKKLLRFEGEISEKRPDLDYKFDEFE